MADLPDANGVWLVSSIMLATRVHTLDGVTLTDTGMHSQIGELVGLTRAPR